MAWQTLSSVYFSLPFYPRSKPHKRALLLCSEFFFIPSPETCLADVCNQSGVVQVFVFFCMLIFVLDVLIILQAFKAFSYK